MVFGLDSPTTIGPDVLARRPPVLPPPPEAPVVVPAGGPLAFPAGRAWGTRSVCVRRPLGRQRYQRRQGERSHAPAPPAPRAPAASSPRHSPPRPPPSTIVRTPTQRRGLANPASLFQCSIDPGLQNGGREGRRERRGEKKLQNCLSDCLDFKVLRFKRPGRGVGVRVFTEKPGCRPGGGGPCPLWTSVH